MFQETVDKLGIYCLRKDWEKISEIVKLCPSVVWDGRFSIYHMNNFSLPTVAAGLGNLEQLKLYNRTIRDNSSPALLTDRLLLAFESKSGKPNKDPNVDVDREFTAASEAASNNFVEGLLYLVEECCPSGALVLQERNYKGATPLTYALMSGALEAVDYILHTAPRGLAMMDDISYGDLTNWHFGMSEDYNFNPTLREYLENVKEIFLLEEAERLETAANYLEDDDGYSLPSTMLNVARDQSRVLEFRGRRARNRNPRIQN